MTVDITEPYAYRLSGKCVVSPFASTPDEGCIWINRPTSKYYLAADVVRSGNMPEWW